MNVTVNQIRQEMTTLVQAHEMVNSFFWGDFHRAYNEKDQFYPLVCSYLSDGAINTNMTQMQLVVIVCDKTFKGFENLNDTESDTLTVARHLRNVISQSPRWNALLRVNSATFTKFYENTTDEVAGVILTMNVDLKQSRSLCDLPLDNYDFDGTFVGAECEDVLIVNSNQSFSFNAPSGTIVELPDTPVLVTNQDGNPLANENLPSVSGGVIQVDIAPANYVVEYADGTPIESGTIPSGGYVMVVVPNPEPVNWTLFDTDGNVLDSGTEPAGGTLTIVAPDATFSINGVQVATIPSGGSDSIEVRKANGSNQIGSLQGQYWRVPNSEITLKDTDDNTLSTTSVPATESAEIIAPNATIENTNETFIASVLSGGTLVLDDQNIEVNGELEGAFVAMQTLEIETLDEDMNVTSPIVSFEPEILTIEVETLDTLTWAFLVVNWDNPPTFVATIAGYDVYLYTLNSVDRYRSIPEPYVNNLDAFWEDFDGTNLINLITNRL